MIYPKYSQGWRPCYGLAFLTFLCNNDVLENLFALAGKHFSPLDCNKDIEIADCTTTFSSLWNTASIQNDEVVIPCGTCAVVDYTDGSTIKFKKGLNIQGKLFFPPTANVEIYTSHVFIMGVLEMDPPAAGNKVKFRFFGDTDQYLHPIDNNSNACDATEGCKMGKKPFAVAGGKLNIHGLADPTCPSWARLQDLKSSDTDGVLNRVVVGNHAASCWNVGDTIFLTSPDWSLENTFSTTVLDIDVALGEINVESIPPVFAYVTILTAPDYAVEVATINRSIILDADDENHATSCWNVGDTIFLTSPDWSLDNTFSTTVLDIDVVLGEIIVESIPPVFAHVTILTAPDYAVEVATINRSIILDADDDDFQNGDGFLGGHLIIYHTPNVIQIIEGVEINNFGQQGNLGRYPIHFHMCDDVLDQLFINRSIILDADDDDFQNGGGVMGGHIIIYHTPNVTQIIEGVEINNFGQQGNLGRYPIHFHMSGDVSGSIISKNVVHHSNQRGFVIHSSHNVQLVDNVAFEIFGHCYFTEDGIETGNIFKHNLGAVIRMPANIIPNENDHSPAVFWITNPNNHWIENVASGSQKSGFWFDLRLNVRGSSAKLPGAELIRPFFCEPWNVPQQQAKGNGGNGIQYYSPGWRPNEEQILQDSRVYRNFHHGNFVHGNVNLSFVGGLIADNLGAFQYFNNDMIHFDGINIIGYSAEYDNVLKETKSQWWCTHPKFEIVGLEFYMDRLEPLRPENSMVATGLSFSGFGNKKCPGVALTMGVTFMETGELSYNSREQLSNITFMDEETAASPISFCKAMDYGGTSIAIQDLDGSLDPNKSGMPGFLVSNETKMATFVNGIGCTEIPGSCAMFCQEACLRNIKVRANGAFSQQHVEMVVTNANGKMDVVGWSRYDFGPENLSYNTRIEWEGSFGIALPAGLYNFGFRDKSTLQSVWPDWAYINYEPAPAACTEYAADDSIIFEEMPIFDVTRCSSNLLTNGDFESADLPGLSGWQNNEMDLELVQSEPGFALKAKVNSNRHVASHYISQYIDRSCLDSLVKLEFNADVRFEDSNSGKKDWCHGISCPKATIDFIGEEWYEAPILSLVIGTISNTESVNGWYRMHGNLVLNEYYEIPNRVMLKIEQLHDKSDFFIDNVSLEVTKATSVPSTPLVPTISPEPTPTVVNLALGKPAMQSTTLSPYGAFLAVDGNTNGNFGAGSTSSTGSGNNYWMVDLQAVASIRSIKIYNRLDCCKERLNNATISVLDYNQHIVHVQTLTDDSPDIATFTFGNVEGTYVRIFVSNVLSLAEVEVYGYHLNDVPTLFPTIKPTAVPSLLPSISNMPSSLTSSSKPNLALYKPAQQSTTGSNAGADLAVDGNTNGNFYDGSVAHTLGGNNWWMVDLQVIAAIRDVKIFNRIDCTSCMSLLNQFVIEVFDYDMNVVFSQDYNETAGAIIHLLMEDVKGSYMRISVTNKYLVLAEVEVYGTILSPTIPKSNLALYKPAQQSSTAGNAVALLAIDGNTNGNFHDGSVTHTLGGNNWWMVNLQVTSVIRDVKIYNRIDCGAVCMTWLNQFVVEVLNYDMHVVSSLTYNDTAGAIIHLMMGNVIGSYIRIAVTNNYLCLAEVEVYGTTLSPTISPSPITTTSAPVESPSAKPSSVPTRSLIRTSVPSSPPTHSLTLSPSKSISSTPTHAFTQLQSTSTW
eukprot:CAMPEP_0194445784 /NCGR_PEP_ID=MMETSP0176-20130528/128058_1 /TAXON_ID=216777 /ORGANISM="Proboscia alata, Strain PI-D3" /LENGTH=1683 /DNA_ID=CAMNT_0039272393 /DNA_START=372 /DNA_END=5422 /DNA_ORIENTATION=+